MFRLTTLDLENVPKDENGNVDYSKDFFGKSTNLTVSGQLECETYAVSYTHLDVYKRQQTDS